MQRGSTPGAVVRRPGRTDLAQGESGTWNFLRGRRLVSGESGASRSGRAALALALAFLVSTCSGGGSSSGGGTGPSPGVSGFGGGGLFTTTSAATLDDLAQQGDIVGELEIAAPSVSPFLLHGTLPVPRRSFVPGQGDVPFEIIDPDGNVSQAQVETTTRYADDADGADVIEILARVRKPVSAQVGDRLRYRVVYQHHAPGTCQPDASVDQMLATPGALTLRTHDCFGNEYSADLYADARTNSGSMQMQKRGRAIAQVRTHEVLEPVAPTAGPQGTLSHMMGVHTYVTRITGESFVQLDLRVHNGFSGADANTTDDDPLGQIYFDALELVVPQGWVLLNAFDDPYFGTPHDDDSNGTTVYPIVAPIDGTHGGSAGQLHTMPAMSQFHRRFALARAGSEANALSEMREEGHGFARAGTSAAGHAYFSWWNPTTGRYFTARRELPTLAPVTESSLRGSLAGQFSSLATQVATGSTGQFPVQEVNLGWAHPYGIQQGGMVSGSEIYLFDGIDVAYSASTDGYRLHQLTHRMYAERQPNVMFNTDGAHTQVSQWVVHTGGGDYLPVWWYNAPMLWASDPFGYSDAPTFQVEAVAAANRQPWYEGELSGYEPCDFQHLVRYMRSTKVLVWLGNDTIAKDDARAQAEGFRFGYSSLPQDLYGNIIPTGLLSAQNYVHDFPYTGLAYGRGEAWGLDAALVAYSTGNDAWRADVRPWFRDILQLLYDGQCQCSGIIQATPQYNVLGSLYRCRQSIEAAIMETAFVGLRESVFAITDPDRVDRLNGILSRSFYSLISPLVWTDQFNGPWALMAVGPFDMDIPPYCTFVPDDGHYPYADHYQIWSSFAYAYELTHDQQFLDKAALGLGGSFASTLIPDPLNNVQNRAALLDLAQHLANP